MPGSPSSTRAGAQRVDAEGDEDNLSRSYYDGDDDPVMNLGGKASPVDAKALRELVTGYYRLAARGDGARACQLLYLPTAESVAEDYGSRRVLRSGGCATALTEFFRSHRREFAVKADALRFVRLRVEGDRGATMVNFGHGGDRYLLVHREGGAWRLEMAFDVGMP